MFVFNKRENIYTLAHLWGSLTIGLVFNSFLQIYPFNMLLLLLNNKHNTFIATAISALHMVMKRNRERNVLFNNALNTFYLRLYGVRHMVKDHSDIEKGNPLPPHRLLLLINSKGSFICTIPQT